MKTKVVLPHLSGNCLYFGHKELKILTKMHKFVFFEFPSEMLEFIFLEFSILSRLLILWLCKWDHVHFIPSILHHQPKKRKGRLILVFVLGKYFQFPLLSCWFFKCISCCQFAYPFPFHLVAKLMEWQDLLVPSSLLSFPLFMVFGCITLIMLWVYGISSNK